MLWSKEKGEPGLEIQVGGGERYVTLNRIVQVVLLESWYWTKAAREPRGYLERNISQCEPYRQMPGSFKEQLRRPGVGGLQEKNKWESDGKWDQTGSGEQQTYRDCRPCKDLGFYAGKNGAPLENCLQRHMISILKGLLCLYNSMSWAGHLTSLSCSFLACKMSIIFPIWQYYVLNYSPYL